MGKRRVAAGLLLLFFTKDSIIKVAKLVLYDKREAEL